MCKLFAVTDVSDLTIPGVQKLLRSIRNTMVLSEYNGFGFSFVTEHNDIYTERYTNPEEFHEIGKGEGVEEFGELSKFVKPSDTNVEGVLGRPAGCLIAHGRTATNSWCIENTHPFTKKGWAFAHNGVVDYQGQEIRPKYSTCDSEDLLNAYVYGSGCREFSSNFDGYAAFLAITPERNLMVSRDYKTYLYAAVEPSTGRFIFATTKTLILNVAKTMRWKLSKIVLMRGHEEVTMNETGSVIGHRLWNPFSASAALHQRYAHLTDKSQQHQQQRRFHGTTHEAAL